MARKFLGGTPTVGTTPVVIETRQISISPGTGGGDLSADRTLTVTDGTTATKGVVQLEDSYTSTSTTKAATPNAVKTTYDLAAAAVPTTRTITATDPITIDGTTSANLSANRTIAVKDATSAGQKGVVALTDSVASTSTTTAAVPANVKTAYDLAAAAVPKSTVTTIGDLIIGAGSPAVPTRLAIGATSGSVLTSNGTTASWSAAPTLTNATIATPTLTLKSGTAPTTEGVIEWDTTNDIIVVGDGSTTKKFFAASNPSIVADFSKSGTLATGTGTFRWYNDSGKTLTIGAVRASVGTAPTGASLIVDVNTSVSGGSPATIFTASGDKPTITASSFTDLGGSKSVTTIANGDYITVDIDQVGSTVAGSDLVVSIWLSYA